MSVFYIDTAKLYAQLFKTIYAVHSFIKVLIYVRYIKTEWLLNGSLRELKNKRKVQLGNYKSGHGQLRERSLTRAFHCKFKFKLQFKRGLTNVVVIRAGRLREWVARRASTVQLYT